MQSSKDEHRSRILVSEEDLFDRALDLFNERSYDEALKILEKLANAFDDCGFSNCCLEENDSFDRPTVLYYLATSLREINKFKSSIEYYEKAKNYLMEQKDSSFIELEDLLNDYALCLVRNANTESSKQLYESVLELNPKNVSALSGLSACYLLMGDIPTSKHLIEKALKLNPEYYHIYHVRGMIHDEEGDYENAIQMYNQSSFLNPMYARSHYNKALSYEKLFMIENAIYEYKECIRLDSTHISSHQNLSYCYLQLGQKDKAIQLLNEILSKNIDTNAMGDISDSFREIGDDEKACQILNVAILQDSSNVELYIKRGHIYKHLEKKKLALLDFSKACELEPFNTEYKTLYRNTYNGPKRHTVALFGDDTYCQLGNASIDERNIVWKPVFVSACNDRIKNIFFGSIFSLFWAEDMAGESCIFECGFLNGEEYLLFDKLVLPPKTGSVKQISASSQYFLILTNDGQLFGKGFNTNFALCLPSNNFNYSTLTQIDTSYLDGKVQSITSGCNILSGIISSNGTLYISGLKKNPQYFKLEENVQVVGFMQNHILYWTRDRKLLKFTPSSTLKEEIKFSYNEDIRKISCGKNHAIFLTKEGNIYGYGISSVGNITNDLNTASICKIVTHSFSPPLYSPIKDVECGSNHCLIISGDNRVYTTGSNLKGELGLGELSNNSISVFTRIEFSNPLINSISSNYCSSALFRSIIVDDQILNNSFKRVYSFYDVVIISSSKNH